ncbi:hypothetical protein VTO73DRAFT_9743 [Trametes versicolor]
MGWERLNDPQRCPAKRVSGGAVLPGSSHARCAWVRGTALAFPSPSAFDLSVRARDRVEPALLRSPTRPRTTSSESSPLRALRLRPRLRPPPSFPALLCFWRPRSAYTPTPLRLPLPNDTDIARNLRAYILQRIFDKTGVLRSSRARIASGLRRLLLRCSWAACSALCAPRTPRAGVQCANVASALASIAPRASTYPPVSAEILVHPTTKRTGFRAAARTSQNRLASRFHGRPIGARMKFIGATPASRPALGFMASAVGRTWGDWGPPVQLSARRYNHALVGYARISRPIRSKPPVARRKSRSPTCDTLHAGTRSVPAHFSPNDVRFVHITWGSRAVPLISR